MIIPTYSHGLMNLLVRLNIWVDRFRDNHFDIFRRCTEDLVRTSRHIATVDFNQQVSQMRSCYPFISLFSEGAVSLSAQRKNSTQEASLRAQRISKT